MSSLYINGTTISEFTSDVYFNGTKLAGGAKIHFNGSAVFTKGYNHGTLVTLYDHSSGQSAVGEGFWRTLESWTATALGYFTVTSTIAMTNASKICDIGVFVNGTEVHRIYTYDVGAGWVTYNGTTDFNTGAIYVGDVITLRAYLWGNYGSDHIDSSRIQVRGV